MVRLKRPEEITTEEDLTISGRRRKTVSGVLVISFMLVFVLGMIAGFGMGRLIK